MQGLALEAQAPQWHLDQLNRGHSIYIMEKRVVLNVVLGKWSKCLYYSVSDTNENYKQQRQWRFKTNLAFEQLN